MIVVLELRAITGDMIIQRDKRIFVSSPVAIESLNLMDPLSWKDHNTREQMNQHYCPNSLEKSLLNRTLTTETALIALRFYMKSVGLRSEYEFYVHYREVAKIPQCKCTCLQQYDAKDLYNVFFAQNGALYLHIDRTTRSKILKENTLESMQPVYEFLDKFIAE
jgi:hypothetical protein